MNYTFYSHFSVRLKSFIAQKNALGYTYYESSRILRNFDLFCLKHYPQETKLTKEICLAWAVRKENECRNTFRNRIFPIREFARYLNCIGEDAYLIPVNLARKGTAAVPHIYTETEILAIWNVLEHLPVKMNFPVRHMVIPALVKLLYCCGLRPSEARKLLSENVDLSKGRLNIIESKAHKSRIVMLTDDVTAMLREYDTAVSAIMPERTHFFPDSHDHIYTKEWLDKTMRLTLKKAGIQSYRKQNPRPYDFRHTFATHRLYLWMREGKDLNAMLPYLSEYMGHAQLSDTYYYIHLVPGLFEEMTGFDDSTSNSLIPEADEDE